MKPTTPITDSAFRWTPSGQTNIRKLFDRIRWERERAGEVPQRVRVDALVVECLATVPRKAA